MVVVKNERENITFLNLHKLNILFDNKKRVEELNNDDEMSSDVE